MKKTRFVLYSLLLASMTLASCNNGGSSYTPQKYGFYTIKPGVTDLSFLQGYPWINTAVAGVLNKIEQPSIKDDFFANVNYDELKDVVIPEGMTKNGGFIYRSNDLVQDRLKDLYLDEDMPLYDIGSYYIQGAKSRVTEELNYAINMSQAQANEFFATKGIFQDNLSQVGLSRNGDGIPLVDFTSNLTNPSLVLLYSVARMLNFIPDLCSGLGILAEAEGAKIENFDNETTQFFDNLMSIYTEANQLENDVVKTTVGELDGVYTGIVNIEQAMNELGYLDTDEVEYSVRSAKFINSFDKLGLDFLRKLTYYTRIFDLRYHIGAENYLKVYKEKLNSNKAFQSNTLDKITDYREYANNILVAKFPISISREYCVKYVTAKARARVTKLIEEIILEYHNMLSQNTWLSEPTRNNAIEKLDAMKYVPFYENGLVNMRRFNANTEDLLALTREYDDYLNYDVVKADFDNRVLSSMQPYTVNAAYIPAVNSFVITHAISATFIDDESISDEFLYGALGGIIGHEISHGFDSKGSTYDKDGKATDWWTKEDKEVFQGKVDKMISYYENDIRAFDDQRFNGKNLNGEITADMGGLKTVIRIGEKINGFDFKKMFEAFASAFAFVYTEKAARDARDTDPHPLSYLRVNVTLAQFDKFLETYDIKEGDGMYIAPEKRVAIW